jgi:CHAD domain-containing protein
MRIQQRLRQYYERLDRDFHQHFTDVLYQYEAETVHQMRVNLKKQTSFFRLLEELDAEFSADLAFEALSSLYKKAGRVRDIQVERTVVSKDESRLRLDHAFSEWLEEQEARQREKLERFEANYSLVPVRELSRHIVDRVRVLPTRRIQDGMPRYFAKAIQRLRVDLEELDERHLHDLRKGIKELYYNLLLLDLLLPQKLSKKSFMRRLNKWQNLLGKWHDKDFIVRRVERKSQPCPDILLQKVEADRHMLHNQIMDWADQLPDLLDDIEGYLVKVWAEGIPDGAHRLKMDKDHPSFSQQNLTEGLR